MVLLRSVLDGNVTEHEDDGYGNNSPQEPGQGRAQIQATLAKRGPDGKKVFYAVELDGFDDVERKAIRLGKVITVKDKAPRYKGCILQPWRSPDGKVFEPVDAPEWDEQCDALLAQNLAIRAEREQAAEERLAANLFSRSAYTELVQQAETADRVKQDAAASRLEALEKKYAEAMALIEKMGADVKADDAKPKAKSSQRGAA